MDDDFASEMMRHFNSIDDSHRRMHEEFRRLLAEPTQKVPCPGDRAIVAIGLLSMGHPWVRAEVEVIEVADTSVKVRIKDHYSFRTNDPDWVAWINPALITDVLPATP